MRTIHLVGMGIGVAATMLAAGISLLVHPNETKQTLPEVSQVNPPTQLAADGMDSAPIPSEGAYILKLKADTLRVYQEGSKEALAEYDLPADWLPDYDRILLEYGLRVTDKESLRRLIEDYVS